MVQIMKYLTGVIILTAIILAMALQKYLKRFTQDKVVIIIVRLYLTFVAIVFSFVIYMFWGMTLESFSYAVPIVFALVFSIGLLGYMFTRFLERIMSGEVVMGVTKEKLISFLSRTSHKNIERK